MLQAVEEMVWPKNKANFSDSFLPPTLQLVSYLMEKLEIRDTSLSEISTAGPASTTSGAVQEVSSALRAQEGSSTASSPPVADEIRKVRSVYLPRIFLCRVPRRRVTEIAYDFVQSQGRARVQARADHAWQELQPMVAYIVLGRLRDALTIEARKRGLNRLQVNDTNSGDLRVQLSVMFIQRQ